MPLVRVPSRRIADPTPSVRAHPSTVRTPGYLLAAERDTAAWFFRWADGLADALPEAAVLVLLDSPAALPAEADAASVGVLRRLADPLAVALAATLTDTVSDSLTDLVRDLAAPRPPSRRRPRPANARPITLGHVHPELATSAAPAILAAVGGPPLPPTTTPALPSPPGPPDPIVNLDLLTRTPPGGLPAHIRAQLAAAGRRTARNFPGPDQPPLPAILSRFNPRVAHEADLHRYHLIVGLVSEQRRAVRAAVTAAVTAPGRSPATLARDLRRILPLTERSARAVFNYRAGLERQQIDADRADRLVSRYADSLRSQRALLVARTEIMRAANSGRRLTHRIAADGGLIGDNAAVEWLVGPSGWAGIHVCERCAPMGGKIVPVDTTFPYTTRRGFGGIAGPPLHPACRCSTRLLPDHYSPRAAELAGPAAPAPDQAPDVFRPADPADHLAPAATVREGQDRVQRYLDSLKGIDPDDLQPYAEWFNTGQQKYLDLTDPAVPEEVFRRFLANPARPTAWFGNSTLDEVNGAIEALRRIDEAGFRPLLTKRLHHYGDWRSYLTATGQSPNRNPGNVWAETWSTNFSSRIGVRSQTTSEWDRQLASSEQTGFHPPHTNTISGIMVHELGHVADMAAGLEAMFGPAYANEMNRVILDAVNEGIAAGLTDLTRPVPKLGTPTFKKAVKQLLSGYATQNPHELIAEAFAEYHLSPDPRPFARRIVSTLLQHLEDRGMYSPPAR